MAILILVNKRGLLSHFNTVWRRLSSFEKELSDLFANNSFEVKYFYMIVFWFSYNKKTQTKIPASQERG